MTKQRRVVCAAIRAANGDLMLGIRHYDVAMHRQMGQMSKEEAARFAHRSGDDQGFVDQFGAYMTRGEAYRIASDARQILNDDACYGGQLYSEGLY